MARENPIPGNIIKQGQGNQCRTPGIKFESQSVQSSNLLPNIVISNTNSSQCEEKNTFKIT